jgi:hypothetical protein
VEVRVSWPDALHAPPDNLPVPIDDGAYDHPAGAIIPRVALTFTFTRGNRVERHESSMARRIVVYA